MDRQASITESDLKRMLFDDTAEPMPLPFSLLEGITNDFSYKMEIGRGGFAVVYKAMLGKWAIAVKRLSNTYMYENEFFREVECLMKVKHKNIVRFLGYCVDTQGNMKKHEGKFVMADIQQRLLCFEYMPNGGLDGYIKDPSCGLEWTNRYVIIKGICEGLDHLHQLNIVHMDLKPANILLDENMEPQITDFGISRSFEEDQTQVLATKVVGTRGYMAPEFVSKQITKKYDLYSLGVIVMEILTGQKMYHSVETITTREKVSHVVETVLKSWSDRLSTSRRMEECEQIRVCVEIGIECTEFDPANRPVNMKHIIERLAETERTDVSQIRGELPTSPGANATVDGADTGVQENAPRMKMFDIGITSSSRSLHSLDINQVKQWIMTGEDNGHVCIWNYQTQKKVVSFKLPERSEVVCIKFIARKQWIAAASGYNIFVYSYEKKLQWITSIKAGTGDKSLHTLAIHPTKPYLLSSDYGKIKIWNWDKNWKLTHTFGQNNSGECIYQIALSSTGTIASTSLDCTVKICSLDSTISYCTLSGHSTSVKCLDFFTRDDREYLVTGSDDQTAKIWYMKKKICIHTLEAFTSPAMFVLYLPNLQILTTGSRDGSIYFWRISSSIRRRPPKLEKTISIGGGYVLALACSIGRVILAKKDGIAIMDIDCVNSWEKSADYSEPQVSADMTQDRDKTSKVVAGLSEELPILDIHPLELHSSGPNDPVMCSLHVTNKTDEHVAFRITKESSESLLCSSELPMYGIVAPRSTYTLDLTTGHKMKLEEETYLNLVVQSSTSGERYTTLLSQSECDEFFEEAEEIGNTVHEVTLRDIYAQHRDTTSKYYDELRPLKHSFYPELGLLQLTNKSDELVAFQLMERTMYSLELAQYFPRTYNFSGPGMCSILPPKSTCTLVMPTRKKGQDLVLQSSIFSNKSIKLFESDDEFDKFFKEAKELRRAVSEVPLTAVYTPRPGETPSELAVRTTKIKEVEHKGHLKNFDPKLDLNDVTSMDAHPAKPWIVMGFHSGAIKIWNYESKRTTELLTVPILEGHESYRLAVMSIKFHATKKWIVALTNDHFIYVYDIALKRNIKNVTGFKACGLSCRSYSLGIHPSKPYVLSAEVQLWDGDKGWKCTRKFRTCITRQLVFNPEDTNTFASVADHSAEVFSLNCTKPVYALNGHSSIVNCLDFFKRGDQQYLITGSHDCTAKIWDLKEKRCIHTLGGFRSEVEYVGYISGRLSLVTCSQEIIHVWSSTDFRLKTTVYLQTGGRFKGLLRLMDSGRIAIWQTFALSIIDIDEEDEEVVARQDNNEDSLYTTGQSSSSR